MTQAEVLTEALKLEARSRAEVAKRLLESLEELSDTELETLWVEEAERRDEAIERGELQALPAEKVFADARARLK
jgi:hypothetical protein